MSHRSRVCGVALVVMMPALVTVVGAPGPVQARASSAVAPSSLADSAEGQTPPSVDLVADLWPGRAFSQPGNIVDLGGVAYFSAEDRSYHRELWRSDGTAGGTWSLGIDEPGQLTPAGEWMYFRARSGLDGQELWRTDGTASGTTALTSTPVPPNGSHDLPDQLTAVGNRLFFTRGEIDGSDVELWTSDGTVEGTRRVADVRPGVESSFPQDLTAVGSDVYFTAYDSLHGRELWRSDGTALGTVRVADIDPRVDPSPLSAGSGPDQLTAVADVVYFVADDATHGRELWTSDGTAPGTHQVADVSDRSSFSSRVGELTAFGDRVFFMAHGDTVDRVLWISDGTAAGTRHVSEVGAGSFMSWLTVMGDHVYFNARDGRGHELWRSDGTPAGTTIVADINPATAEPATYPLGSQPSQLTPVGDELFFLAFDETHGRGVWSTDGTTEGTALVEDVEPVAGDFDEIANWLAAVGDDLYLTVADNAHGAELWSTAAPTAALPKVVNEAPPSVVGAPTFGQTVTADPGSWSPSTASFTYEWYAGERRLDQTGQSLTLDENHVGNPIRVLVTASSPGHRTRSALAAPSTAVAGTVRNQNSPRVIGTARVGAVLSVQQGAWIPAYSSLSYEWFVRGIAAPVGLESTFRVTPSAVGRPVAVRVTAAAPAWDSSSVVSAATAPVMSATFRITRRSELTGRPRVGSRLAVSTGSVAPAAARTTVRWLRDGRPIAAATGSTYKLRLKDRGAHISARITWSRVGHQALTRTTRSTGAIRPRT